MNESNLRENLIEMLRGGQAHLTLEQALDGIRPSLRTVRPEGFEHSMWELLEHTRIAQEDILKYMLDPAYQEMSFPDDYWPPKEKTPADEDWNSSVQGLLAGINRLVEMVEDTRFDLTAKIPHGEWRTYLREILLAADHNAYHLGQIVQLHKQLAGR